MITKNWIRFEKWGTTVAVALPLVILILGSMINGPATGRWAGAFASAIMLILEVGIVTSEGNTKTGGEVYHKRPEKLSMRM